MLKINNNNAGLELRIIKRQVHKAHGHLDGVNVCLRSHIMDDNTHQITIYECLNVDEVGRLFESLHDPSKSIRVTSAHFICRLVHGNPSILESLLLRQHYEVHASHPSHPQPYLLTGLQHYHLPPDHLLRNPCSHTDLVKLLKHLKFKKDALCWHINLANMEVGYMPSSGKEFPVDPNTHMVGVWREEGTLNKRQSVRNFHQRKKSQISQQNKQKYNITKGSKL